MKYAAGQRVGAVMSAVDGKVALFGYGVYEGDKVPPHEIHPTLHEYEIANPCIKLDSGKTVWGFECWWGPEASVKEAVCDQEVIMVDIEEERAKAAVASEK